jgi:hypothetical protein
MDEWVGAGSSTPPGTLGEQVYPHWYHGKDPQKSSEFLLNILQLYQGL